MIELAFIVLFLTWVVAGFLAGFAACLLAGTWLVYKLINFKYSLKEFIRG